MAKYVMIALSPDQVAGRPSFHTGIAMVGQGGHDYICGHCGRAMIQDFDVSTIPGGMVFVCGACEGANDVPQ